MGNREQQGKNWARRVVAVAMSAAAAAALVVGVAAPASAVNIPFGYKDCRGQNGVGTSSWGSYSVTHYFHNNGVVMNKSWANGPGSFNNRYSWDDDQQFDGYAEGTYLDSATTYCW